MMICNRCGLQINNGSWNCPRCGNRLGQENASAAFPQQGFQAANRQTPPQSGASYTPLPPPPPVGVPSTAIESFGAEVSESQNTFQGFGNRMAPQGPGQSGPQTAAPMGNGMEATGLNGYINAQPAWNDGAQTGRAMVPYGQQTPSYPQSADYSTNYNPQTGAGMNPYGGAPAQPQFGQPGMMQQPSQNSYEQQWGGVSAYGQPEYYPPQQAYGQQPGGYGQPTTMGGAPYGQNPYQGQVGWAPNNQPYGQQPMPGAMPLQTPTPRTVPGDTGRIFLSMQEMQAAQNQKGTPVPEKKNGWVGWLIFLIVILVIAFVLLLVYYLKANMPFTLENFQNYYMNLFRSLIDSFKV